MQRQATFSKERRSSGRLRDLSKKYKVSTDATAEIKIERRNARLDFLENDNFVPERSQRDEDDQEFVLDDDAAFTRKKKKRKTGKKARFRKHYANFNAVLEDEYYEAYPPHVPTYYTVAAEPSVFPVRHFCSVCGFTAPYTCTRCGMRFCSTKCNNMHQETRCLKWAV